MAETLLFVTNGDGSVNCAWCEKRFSADDAIPDSNDDPICPQCDEGARSEEAATGTRPSAAEALKCVPESQVKSKQSVKLTNSKRDGGQVTRKPLTK